MQKDVESVELLTYVLNPWNAEDVENVNSAKGGTDENNGRHARVVKNVTNVQHKCKECH